LTRPREKIFRATGTPPRAGRVAARTRQNPAIDGQPNIGQGARAARLQELLGLSEDELCAALGVDALTLLSGRLEHRPELGILLTLIEQAQVQAQAGPQILSRWVRAVGPEGRPIDALTRRDFAAFEDALAHFAERGFVLRGGGASAGG
jgi:hypothetical protein